MWVKRLSLQHFRNYAALDTTLDPGVNLVVGDNAQGKTNLLESLIYLSCGSSYRTRREEELIQWEEPYARLEAEVVGVSRAETITYALFRGRQRRQMMKNGVKQKTAISEVLNTVLFCPEDLQLLRAGSAARRHFLNAAIVQLRPQYRKAVSEYGKLYEHKSRILKDRFEKPSLLEALPEFNQRMAAMGASIIGYRARYLQTLGALAAAYHETCSGGRERLALTYHTVSTITDPFAARETIFEQILDHQSRHAQAEIEACRCLTGPHKDDFEVLLDGRAVKSFGSQGQTRTAAIALKLAEREISKRETGEEPVLLLDDVLSELDRVRRDFILNEIRSGQVVITCCETEKLTEAGKTLVVRNGAVEA